MWIQCASVHSQNIKFERFEFDGQSKIRYNVLSFWPVHHPPLHSPFLYTHSIFTSCADKPIPLVVLACRPHLHSQNLRDKCDRQRQICVLYAYVCMCVYECGERAAGWFWEGNIGSRKWSGSTRDAHTDWQLRMQNIRMHRKTRRQRDSIECN